MLSSMGTSVSSGSVLLTIKDINIRDLESSVRQWRKSYFLALTLFSYPSGHVAFSVAAVLEVLRTTSCDKPKCKVNVNTDRKIAALHVV